MVDNRQFEAYCKYFEEAHHRINIPPERVPAATAIISAMQAAHSFDEMYKAIGSRYYLRPEGTFIGLPSASYDAIVSFHVLEHLAKRAIPSSVKEYFRLLRPGGFSIHQIDLQDHLSLYDRSAHPKQYLSFNEEQWRWCYQNEVQYFNRMQRSDWLRHFENAGFQLIHMEQEPCSLEGLDRISSSFRRLPREELECRMLTTVHQKPR